MPTKIGQFLKFLSRVHLEIWRCARSKERQLIRCRLRLQHGNVRKEKSSIASLRLTVDCLSIGCPLVHQLVSILHTIGSPFRLLTRTIRHRTFTIWSSPRLSTQIWCFLFGRLEKRCSVRAQSERPIHSWLEQL